MSGARLRCYCGAVQLALEGPAILTAHCACNSCRVAAQRIEKLSGRPLREPEDSLAYVLQRRDRLEITAGENHLAEFRLSPASPTRRVIARCCGSLLFTDFKHGHWLSISARLWPEASRPAPQLRTMVMDHPAPASLDSRIPNARRQSLGFMWKLAAAWAAMGFRHGPRRDYPVIELPEPR